MAYRDPADIEEQRKVEDGIEAAAIGMEVAVLAVIARRLGKLEGKSLADVYASMPSDLSEIQSAIKEGTESMKKAAVDSMDDMAAANDEWAKRYYDYKGVEQLPAKEHQAMSAVLEEQTEDATSAIEAKCRSTVIKIANDTTSEVLPIEAAYKQVVTQAATSMTTGLKTVDQAISQAVKTLSKSGLRVLYQSGATRNLYSAVSMNVMDAYRVAMAEMREIQGQEFGADGVEVTAHALCAPDHQEYQGIQYSYEPRRGYRLWSEVQFEPARPLVIGANCGHVVSPVLLGISEPAYSKKELADLTRRSNEQVSFNGLSGKQLTMSRYDASQYQRKVETIIRKANQDAYLFNEANAAKDAAAAKAAAKAYTAQYKRMSPQAGLSTRMDRTRAYVQK